jgi:AcrR family transcriptional regulator
MSALTPRQAQRRQRILEAVRDHLSRHGYDRMNMRDVAGTAQVSPTTLYNLYENKDTLVLSALEDFLTSLGEEISSTDTPGLGRLEVRAQVSAQAILDTPRFAEAMIRMLLNAEPEAPISEFIFNSSVRELESDIRSMQDLGEVREDVDVQRLARNVIANKWTTMLLWTKGYIALLDLPGELTRSLISTVLPAMTPKAARRWQDKATA